MPRDMNTQGFDSSSMNYKSCWARALLAGKISQLGASAAQEVCPLLLQQQEPADELHLARCTRKAPGSPRQVRHRCLGTKAQHGCGHGINSHCPGPAPSLCTRLGTPTPLEEQQESQAMVSPCLMLTRAPINHATHGNAL